MRVSLVVACGMMCVGCCVSGVAYGVLFDGHCLKVLFLLFVVCWSLCVACC